ncbi:MAG: hypothetical protein A2173_03830 [Planctomycetes bacterium RBG_13_44_8b]|nr:MAG: hypothetical protein A2173_03830 [Planctomycetes bacterium RBG_13_44_8b]
MTNPIYATWCLSNNIGDALTPWLIKQITGHTPVYIPFDITFPKYMVCGSVLNHAVNYTTVWGAGFANYEDCVKSTVDIRAVRGPVTAARVALQSGIDVKVWGDPALLMPWFYNPPFYNPPPKDPRRYKVGICPHYIHQREVTEWLAGREDIKFLNVFKSPEHFVDDLIQCEVVYSSSLHGLIIANAYGIPSQWIEGTEKLGGDRSKFKDYLQSLLPVQPLDNELFIPQTLHLQQLPKDIDSLYAAIKDRIPPEEQIRIICDKLWKVCPFRLYPKENESGNHNTNTADKTIDPGLHDTGAGR